MPMPRLSICGSNVGWSLPYGRSSPTDEDLQLALKSGYSRIELEQAFERHQRFSMDTPDAGSLALCDDFLKRQHCRLDLKADPVHTNSFMHLAHLIIEDSFFYGHQSIPLWDWNQARIQRQRVSKDSSGGYLYSLFLNNGNLRREALERLSLTEDSKPFYLLPAHSFRPRKSDENVSAVSNLLAQNLWGSLYLHGGEHEISDYLSKTDLSTISEAWIGSLRSRRALSERPKIRAVYDVSYSSNECLSRLFGPLNALSRLDNSLIMVAVSPQDYSAQLTQSFSNRHIVGADLSTLDKDFSHLQLRTDVDSALQRMNLQGEPPREAQSTPY